MEYNATLTLELALSLKNCHMKRYEGSHSDEYNLSHWFRLTDKLMVAVNEHKYIVDIHFVYYEPDGRERHMHGGGHVRGELNHRLSKAYEERHKLEYILRQRLQEARVNNSGG